MREVALERIATPTREELQRRYVARSRPVILTGAMEGWRAFQRWTPATLRACHGDRRVSVVRAEHGLARYDDRGGVPYETVRFAELLDDLEAASPKWYLVAPLENELAGLLADVGAVPVGRPRAWRRSRFWVAPPDVRGALHCDLPENLYAQVSGRKRWLLFPRRDAARVYARPPWSGVPNYARVDAYAPDLARFPRFAGAHAYSGELAPGEMLFIPSLWWHQARSVTTSISVNFWWADGLLGLAVRSAVAFQRLRGLRL